MKKKNKFQKAQTKNALASFSVVTLILGALILNETFSKTVRPTYIISDNGTPIETLNRAIANAQPMNPFRDLEWEKALAKRLSLNSAADKGSLDGRTPSSVGRGVSSLDQLLFGTLAGKYHLLNHVGDSKADSSAKIKQIEYVESSEANDRPIIISDLDGFLRDYGNLFSVKFDAFDKANPNQTNVREYRLLNGQKKLVGIAAFFVDHEGRLLSLKVREASNDSSY